MKKHLLSFVLLALTLGWSANSWADVTMPAGTYYFTFPDNTFTQVDIFNNHGNNITFDSNNACNSDLSRNSNTSYSGKTHYLSTIVVSVSSSFTANGSFMQVQENKSTWKGWKDYTSPTNIGTDAAKVFVCQIHNDGTYNWASDASAIPSCGGGDDPDPTPPTPPTTLKLDGNWSDHSWNNCHNLTQNENIFTTTINVTNTTKFECCFKDDDQCKNAVIKPNMTSVEYSGTNCTVGNSGNPNYNFTVTPNHTGDIDIIVTYGNKISVVFALVEPCANCKTITK